MNPSEKRRLWRGFQVAIADQRRDPLGGVCFNDDYNTQHFGITRAEFFDMQRRAEDLLGMDWREAKIKEVFP